MRIDSWTFLKKQMKKAIKTTQRIPPNSEKQGKILLAHGSGGKLMHDLIHELILPKLRNSLLEKLADSATVDFGGQRLAFTTDSFVVSPLFFHGGDIGKLAVFGTINDLLVVGAIPLYISLALIIEEGLDYLLLERVINSIATAVNKSRVKVITGDIKVVPKGACDKLFINTSGIGRVIKNLQMRDIQTEDMIIITGRIAEHGLSILSQRKGIDLDIDIRSDCASLDTLLIGLLRRSNAVKFMRDPTRGGIATTLNEIAKASNLGIIVEEEKIPISNRIKAVCELLGIDPLYVANEGKAILITRPNAARDILRYLKQHPQGKSAQIIGKILPNPKGKVILKTLIGTNRILEMTSYDPLPRIC